MRKGRRGIYSHGGCDEANSELGEAPERAGRREGSPAAGDEDDEEGSMAAAPGRSSKSRLP